MFKEVIAKSNVAFAVLENGGSTEVPPVAMCGAISLAYLNGILTACRILGREDEAKKLKEDLTIQIQGILAERKGKLEIPTPAEVDGISKLRPQDFQRLRK